MIVIIFRTVLMYLFVILGIRLMGKRQIGDMQPNELVITLLISEIAAIPLQDLSQPLLNGIIAIFTLVVLEISVSVLALKSISLRKLLNGQSVVIIKNGILDQQAMKRVRLSVIELMELLRGQNVFDISTVAFAVLEVNGELSVLLKADEQNPTAKDFGIEKKGEFLSMPVVCDGKLMQESLSALQLEAKTVEEVLRKSNLTINEVFLLTLDRQNNANIIRRKP